MLHWVLSDHLGSTSTTANQDGSFSSTIQYTAFGEIRVTKNTTLTKYRYTGQLAQAELGLDYYVARWYDPVIGHFTQADTIIPEPGKASAFDRYAYVKNNPIRLNDPSGHSDSGACGPGEDCDESDEEEVESNKNALINTLEEIYNDDESLQKNGITKDDFLNGYKAYQYYQTHPQEALNDCINDTDSYTLADTYSEYYLHQMFQPFDEGAVSIFIEQARKSNDAKSYYAGLAWLATSLTFQGADKGYGGGSSSSSELIQLTKGDIKMLKKANFDIHEIKGNVRTGQTDLFKDEKGNIYILLKGGRGFPDETGINLNNLIEK